MGFILSLEARPNENFSDHQQRQARSSTSFGLSSPYQVNRNAGKH